MVNEKEKLLENFNQVKQVAENYLVDNNFKNYIIKDIVRYNKEVNLIRKDSKDNETHSFNLYVVELENIDTEREEDALTELEFLVEENEDGQINKIYTISDLIHEYEAFENIKDVVDKTKENEEKPEKEQDEELKKDSLNSLEKEKEEETKENIEKSDKESNEQENKKNKNDLTGIIPRNVMQTIDVDQAYIDNWTTVRKGFKLPPEVKKLAIASPIQNDNQMLSATMTIYMIDNNGKIIENVNGKTIRDYFEIDDATGHNPVDDDNVKLELLGHAEVDQDKTMRRFKSLENPNLYLSIEQKDIGGYHEVYAGRKTLNGNDAVEIQLETRNTEIQTDFDMQKIFSGRRGEYNADNIDKETELHSKHDDNEEEIPIENADGDKYTRVNCDSPYVPDTHITWEEFSKIIGNKDTNELMKDFFKEYEHGKGNELVIKMQSEYKENKENTKDDEENTIDDEENARVPWDRTRH